MSDNKYDARKRDHELPHLRSLDQQILDALLRIEELLTLIADNTRPSGTKAIAPKGKK